jgi:hypothetical protein
MIGARRDTVSINRTAMWRDADVAAFALLQVGALSSALAGNLPQRSWLLSAAAKFRKEAAAAAAVWTAPLYWTTYGICRCVCV